MASRTYVDVNIHDAANADRLAQLDQLPVNCAESADRLLEKREVFEAHGVFSPDMIDGNMTCENWAQLTSLEGCPRSIGKGTYPAP